MTTNNLPGHWRVAALHKLAERVLATVPDGKDMDNDTLNASISVASALSNNVTKIADRIAALHQLAVVKSPLESDIIYRRKLTKAVAVLEGYIRERQANNADIVQQAHQTLDRVVAGRVNLTQDQYAPEIRARFASLSADKRLGLLGELIERNAGPELAAVLQAPAMLTGLTEEQQASYIDALYRKQAPAAFVARASIADAVSNADAAMKIATAEVREFAGRHALEDIDNPQRVVEFQAAQRRADEAAAAFNGPDAA